MKIREAQFALRVVRRKEGLAGIAYRRGLKNKGQERLQKIAAISPLALSAGTPLLRAAVKASGGGEGKLTTGPFHPLDPDWGARVACYAILAHGLRDADRLFRAADNLKNLDATEAAWWLGLMDRGRKLKAVRALRILTEATE